MLRGSRHVRPTFHWLRASELFPCSIANRPADFFFESIDLLFAYIFSNLFTSLEWNDSSAGGSACSKCLCARVCWCKSRVRHLRCDWALWCKDKDLLIVSQCLFQAHASLSLKANMGSQQTSMLSRLNETMRNSGQSVFSIHIP